MSLLVIAIMSYFPLHVLIHLYRAERSRKRAALARRSGQQPIKPKRRGWLGDGALAVAAGAIGFGAVVGGIVRLGEGVWDTEVMAGCTIVGIIPSAVAVVLFGLLRRRYAQRYETETVCRKCRYILRGISTPRCPECGERI